MKTLNDFLYSEIQYNDKHGKFKNKNLTPVMFYELWDICCAVSRGDAQNTISKDVADICEKYGLSVQTEGVGWRVSGGDEMNSKTICGHCKRIEYCRMFLKDPHAVVSECGKYEETELHKSVRENLTDIRRRGKNDRDREAAESHSKRTEYHAEGTRQADAYYRG